MHVDPQIPSLNEKPTGKEIIGTIPFVAKFVFCSAPKTFLIWAFFGFLQIPLASGSVFALKAFMDALSRGDFAQANMLVWVLLGVYAAMGLNQNIVDYETDVLRYRLEYVSNEEVIRLTSSLPFSVLERTEFRVLSDAFDRKGYVFINIVYWAFWTIFYAAGSIGYLAVIAFIPWQATLVLLGTIVLRILISKRESLWQWSLFTHEQREGRRAMYLRHTLTLPFTLLPVKSWGLQLPFVKKWKQLTEGLLKATLDNLRKMNSAYAGIECLYVMALGVALFYLLRNADAGAVEIGSVSAFLVAFPSFWGKIGSALSNYRMIRREASFLVIARDFLSLSPEQDTGKSVPDSPLTVEFRDVHFTYPGSAEEVLRGVTCCFREGERFALVGLNGAGKSTLLKLLMGIFCPTQGRILVNGIDLANIKPSAWRRALSVMGQDVPRFDDTIREQIVYGDYTKRVDRDRLETAIDASGLRTVLPDFKKGLETHAGKQYAMTEDEAIELSGGQNQIVGIARTLYRDARMFIFDEPTSAVDPEKEENFFLSLPEALEGKGIIFVSHRFSTLRQAEHIIVIDAGRVIEEGSHDVLMEKKGRYAELFTLQAKAYRE